ncbi:hypothetical protein J2S50_007189 [Streptomyces sp. DSM 40167]|nr:hypothetical protein [Streptomyces sp. DSM 40167]
MSTLDSAAEMFTPSLGVRHSAPGHTTTVTTPLRRTTA